MTVKEYIDKIDDWFTKKIQTADTRNTALTAEDNIFIILQAYHLVLSNLINEPEIEFKKTVFYYDLEYHIGAPCKDYVFDKILVKPINHPENKKQYIIKNISVTYPIGSRKIVVITVELTNGLTYNNIFDQASILEACCQEARRKLSEEEQCYLILKGLK